MCIRLNCTIKMKNISFTKMSGAGNDFIMIDKSSFPEISFANGEISKLCDRRNGIGADGVIIVSNSNSYDFAMDYYNADGSTGTLCGNGARCSILFAKNSGRLSGKETNFLANDLEYSGELLDDGLVKFNLKEPIDIRTEINVKCMGGNIPASYIHTGSPHVVILYDDILKNLEEKIVEKSFDEIPVVEIGREIRNLSEFAPGGTNVNFIKIENDEVLIRTYERGVEDETLACGTGSVAAAVISYLKFGIKPPVTLITRGKEKLFVNFAVKDGKFAGLSLTGPAKEVYKGEIFLTNLSN